MALADLFPKEMKRLEQDRHLDEAARAMIAAAARSQSPVKVLQQQCPHIYRQIRRLRECRPLLSLWGRSRNVDEYAQQPIVHSAILQAIGQVADVPLRGQIVHAGLEHTYGYLFSLIETPFGHKRDRWTQSAIEDGFGIRVPTLRAEPVEGSLLTNLTWFAGHIAFRDRPRELRRLQRMSAYVSPVAREYPYLGLDLCRVCEVVTIPSTGRGRQSLQLRTDLVPFPCQPAERATDNHLLVYSVHNEGAGSARLITVFAVTQAVVNELTAPENQDCVFLKDLPYNAYVRGLGRPFKARRHVLRAAREP